MVSELFWQINEARQCTHAQLAVELFKQLRDKDVLDILRTIYELEPDKVKKLSTSNDEENEKLRHRIESVIDKFELPGALVAQRIIDKCVAIEAYDSPPALKLWHQLGEDYIEIVRNQRDLFCKYLEDLAACTYEHQRIHSPKNQWVRFYRREDDKPINQVEYFEKHQESRPKQYKQIHHGCSNIR